MKKILILSANPINTNRLRLDEEVREIRLALKRAQNREAFQLIPIGAAHIDDLRQTLLENNPNIVHFSGHGTGTEGLVLENTSGEPQIVSTESLSDLFELFKEQIECVLLNACYSEIQASAIHQHIDCVIGMTQPIQDDAAINFSKGFYDAIFSGRNYADAFRFGCNNIDLNNIPSSHTPTIKIRHKDSSPQQPVTNNTYKLVIGTAVLGLSAGLVGLVQLAFGKAGLITNVLLAFGCVTLWVCCAYIYYPSSRIFGFGVTPRLLLKHYKRLRRLSLAVMIIIPILSATGFYVLQLPTKDIIVLLANFESSSEQKNYRVTKNIFDNLEDATRNYPDIKIQRLNEVVTEQKDARNEGGKHKATIVIWGDYGVTDIAVQLSPHFEVLRTPKYLPEIGRLEQISAVSELKSFKLQTRLSKEMVYLSLFTVGLTRYTASDWDKAITYFSEALKQVKEPIKELDKSRIYFYRASAYYNLKDYDRAIADSNQALKLDPSLALAYSNRGAVYLDKKDYDRAIADSNQALKLDPSLAQAYSNRGAAYVYKKDYNRAIADSNQALKLDPSLAQAYGNRGSAYLEKKDYDRAIADSNQALKLDPSLALVYSNRGSAYVYKKDDDRAIADFNQALKLDPSLALVYSNRGSAYLEKKDYDRAIPDFNQTLKLDPNNANAYIGRGYAYLYKKDYDRDIADFNKAVQLNPNDANAYESRCEAYRKKGDNDSAITDCNQALKLDPNNANAYIGRGYAYLYKKDYDRAIPDFNKAVQLNPNDANAYDSRCEAYRKKGDNDSAITDCNQALKLYSTFTNSYYNRGLAYKNKGSLDLALKDFKKVLELNDRVELSQKARQHLQELGTF